MNLDYEIATTIPREPGYVPRRDLIEEFWPKLKAHKAQAKLTACVERLRRQGFAIRGLRLAKDDLVQGYGLTVPRLSWEEHERRCEEYLAQVEAKV